jgi:biotin carboxyl carrier protein
MSAREERAMSQPSQQTKMFRKAALDRMSSPERLDQMMKITSRRGWLALVGLIALVVVALIWGIFGRVPTTISGQGLIIRPGGSFPVPALTVGQVAAINVAAGDLVVQGQVLATVQPLSGGDPVPVTSIQDGRVLEVQVDVGNVVNTGTSVALMDDISKPLEGVLFLPSPLGKQIQLGMEVKVAPLSVDQQNYGHMIGTVSWIAPSPSTPQGLTRLLENESMVQGIIQSTGGSPIEVHVSLAEDPRAPSHFRWSSGRGPNLVITTGTLFSSQIVISEQRPLELVLPSFGTIASLTSGNRP